MMPLADIDHLQQEKQVLCGTQITQSVDYRRFIRGMSRMCVLEQTSLKPSPVESYLNFCIVVTNKIKLQNTKHLSCKQFRKGVTIFHLNGHIDLNGVY